jgi:hypothetical protein
MTVITTAVINVYIIKTCCGWMGLFITVTLFLVSFSYILFFLLRGKEKLGYLPGLVDLHDFGNNF